jgi:hypothetical protein
MVTDMPPVISTISLVATHTKGSVGSMAILQAEAEVLRMRLMIASDSPNVRAILPGLMPDWLAARMALTCPGPIAWARSSGLRR